MDVILSQELVDLQESDLLVSGFFQDEKPFRGSTGWIDWRLNGRLSRFLIQNRFSGEWMERVLIPSEGRIASRLILLLGLGRIREYSYLVVRELVASILDVIKNLKASHLSFSLPYGEEYKVDCDKLTAVLIESLVDRLDRHPSDREWIENLTLSFGEGEERFSDILFGAQTARALLKDRLRIRLLTPSNPQDKTPPPI